ALVTTHKLAVWEEASDLFAEVDEHAKRLQEISCISKDRNGQLVGHAKDPITSGKAMGFILEENHWQTHPQAEALVLGCGGAGTAIIEKLLSGEEGKIPEKITGLEHNKGRLEKLRNDFSHAENLILEASDSSGISAESIMAKLPPQSLIVNATGMGKDLPGSPIPNSSNFPDHAIVWELNYRGSLEFYRHAQDQQKKRKMRVHDGWDYFLLGWSSVMEEVFHFELTESLMLQLKQTAKPLRNV
ncbi:MAG: shikimate dehydrogenase, partial [SAR324 cluster bacterium]|nr:shikimate dehydrogenase [SAR324 cluster bacterium]